jgi:hypothetical protein
VRDGRKEASGWVELALWILHRSFVRYKSTIIVYYSRSNEDHDWFHFFFHERNIESVSVAGKVIDVLIYRLAATKRVGRAGSK